MVPKDRLKVHLHLFHSTIGRAQANRYRNVKRDEMYDDYFVISLISRFDGVTICTNRGNLLPKNGNEQVFIAKLN